MKKALALLAVVIVALSCGDECRANDPYASNPYMTQRDVQDSRYGWCPCLRKFFGIKKQRVYPQPPPPAVGGTLVFPNHPFARSPRDYFMVD